MWKNRDVVNIPEIRLIAGFLLSAMFISACSGLNRSDKPALTTWWLEPYKYNVTVPSTEPPVPVSVSVTVIPGLDTQQILTLSENAEMNKFAAARWADSLPELTTSLVARSLESSGRFEVLSGGGNSNACDLELEVREFYARLDSSGQTRGVRVAMHGRYLCTGSEPVMIHLNALTPVNDDRMTVIVAAFQQAVDDVMKDLLKTI